MREENEKQDITQRLQLNTVKKQKGKQSKLLVILRVLIGLSLIAVAVFAVVLLRSNHQYAIGNSVYNDLRSIQQVSRVDQQETDVSSEQPSDLLTEDSTTEPPGEQTAQALAGQSGTSAGKGPATAPVSSSMNFEPLSAINGDIVAWLFAEGRSIDLPVVQGTDNDYYLNHLFDHQYNKLGTLFVDYQSEGDFSNKNTVIYGHNMSDGAMFSVLENYKDQVFYESFPEMDLFTPGGDYTIELFAGVVVSGDYKYIRLDFQDDVDYLSYIISLKEKSTFDSPVEVTQNDRIVTLSTCIYDFDNARYVLFGKLVPKK